MRHDNKWDFPTRFLHWVIALSLIGLFLTALLGEAAEDVYGRRAETLVFYIHLYLGFVAMGAALLRLGWGFFGNGAVNWRGVAAGMASYPEALRAELAWLTTGKDQGGRSRAAHNPLAAPVYIAVLLFFAIEAASGLMLWPHLEQKAVRHGVIATPSAQAAPADLARFVPDVDGHHDGHGDEGGGWGEEIAEELHEFGMIWLPLYLLLHFGGIFIHYVREDRNVIGNMLKL